MKQYISLIILASFTLVLSGHSKDSPAASTRPAIDLVQAGKDVEFSGGYILHVAKREGDALEGVDVRIMPADGQASEITAEKGTIKSGTPENPDFKNQITITLHNAKTVSGPTNFTSALVEIVLHN